MQSTCDFQMKILVLDDSPMNVNKGFTDELISDNSRWGDMWDHLIDA